MSSDERTVIENSSGAETERKIHAENLVKELNLQLQWLEGLEKLRPESEWLEEQ
jgi:hypothetical protein